MGPLDKVRSLRHQGWVFDWLNTMGLSSLIQLGTDDFLALLRIDHHKSRLQLALVIIERGRRDRIRRQKTVALGHIGKDDLLAATQVQGAVQNLTTEQGRDPVQRANPSEA